MLTLTTSSGFGANVAYMNRYRAQQPFVVNRITVASIVVSSGNLCLAIYDDDGGSGEPGTRLSTTGSVASPGTGQRTFTIPQCTVNGVYYIGLSGDNGTFSVGIDQGNKYDPVAGAAITSPFRNKSSAFPLPDPMTSAAATSLGPAAWAHFA